MLELQGPIRNFKDMDSFTALQKIEQLATFKDDWDFQDGKAIHPDAVTMAKYLIEHYPAPDFIGSTPGGEIGMEWGGDKLSVYMGEEGYSYLYCPTPDPRSFIDKENATPEEIEELIRRVKAP